jgi:hypothetical protein
MARILGNHKGAPAPFYGYSHTKRLGLSFWEYYNMERGHAKIGGAELFMIARACGCGYQEMCKEVVRLFEGGPGP